MSEPTSTFIPKPPDYVPDGNVPKRRGLLFVLAIVGVILMFAGFIGMLYGEFGPSVGELGLLSRGVFHASIVALGISFILFSLMLVYRDKQLSSSKEDPKKVVKDFAREILLLCLSILIYGGFGLLTLGAFTAIDRAPVAAIVIMVLCIAAIVLYRRYRIKHPIGLRYVNKAWIPVFLAALGICLVLVGAPDLKGVIEDAAHGPEEAEVLVSGFDVNKATGRYSGFRSSEVLIDLKTVDGQVIPVMIKEQDAGYALELVNSPYVFKQIVYYPNSHVLVSAQES